VQQILTTDEIRELTKAFGTVDRVSRDTRRVRSYNFARPEKRSKSRLRAAERLFEDLGRAWSRTLSTVLKSQVQVAVSSVEEVAFSDFVQTLPDPCAIAVIQAEQGGFVHLDMPAGTALALVNRLTGGRGEIHQRRTKLTHIEQVLLKLIAGRLCGGLSSVCSVKFSVSDVSQSVATPGDPDAALVVAGMGWRINGREHRINLALDPALVEQYSLSLAETTPNSGSGRHTPDPQILEAMLGSVPVPVAADLGHARVTMQELASMEVGDIIRLDHRANEPISIKLGKQDAFHSRIGLSGDKVAVQINRAS